MILGQWLQRIAGELIDTAIANVKQVRSGGFNHHSAEGTHIATIQVIAELALPGLGIKPCIGGLQYPLGGGFNRPGGGGGVVVC